jgi:hypothetical protein
MLPKLKILMMSPVVKPLMVNAGDPELALPTTLPEAMVKRMLVTPGT